MKLITLQEALDHLRVDDAADPTVEGYVDAASAAIYQYIGDEAYIDADPNNDARDDVKSACKLLVGDFYRYREPTNNDPVNTQYGYGYLPRYVTALLFPYRKLVVG